MNRRAFIIGGTAALLTFSQTGYIVYAKKGGGGGSRGGGSRGGGSRGGSVRIGSSSFRSSSSRNNSSPYIGAWSSRTSPYGYTSTFVHSIASRRTIVSGTDNSPNRSVAYRPRFYSPYGYHYGSYMNVGLPSQPQGLITQQLYHEDIEDGRLRRWILRLTTRFSQQFPTANSQRLLRREIPEGVRITAHTINGYWTRTKNKIYYTEISYQDEYVLVLLNGTAILGLSDKYHNENNPLAVVGTGPWPRR
ncbi:MAG: hypothetical protein AAF639_29925 [Chloroflexota bacterium]